MNAYIRSIVCTAEHYELGVRGPIDKLRDKADVFMRIFLIEVIGRQSVLPKRCRGISGLKSVSSRSMQCYRPRNV
jgi:hypothetical protein